MSDEKTRLPIMCDAIMFHNEARMKPHHPFSIQPDTAFTGLNEKKIIPQPIGSVPVKQYKPTGVLYTQSHGYTHTGTNMGVNFQIPQQDPNWTRPVYGNSKPTCLNYSTPRTNLLSRY